MVTLWPSLAIFSTIAPEHGAQHECSKTFIGAEGFSGGVADASGVAGSDDGGDDASGFELQNARHVVGNRADGALLCGHARAKR
eukprot:1353200-Pleurochrysis_carterae.AAC.1